MAAARYDSGMIRREAHAKLNLTLEVLGRRADGFHELESWAVPIALTDELRFEAADEFRLIIEPHAAVPLTNDASNLIHRAAQALADAAGHAARVRIHLVKRIPIGGGLGGGSSDAAATLSALSELWNLDWSIDQLAAIGATLGSDVPFFLTGGQSVMRGRGEVLARARGWQGIAAVIFPPFGVSTADVYRCHARRAGNPLAAASSRSNATPWEARDIGADRLLPMLFNDLEAAAFEVEPRLAELHARLSQAGGRIVRMTGSGSCLFTLFDDASAAEIWHVKIEPVLAAGERVILTRVLG